MMERQDIQKKIGELDMQDVAAEVVCNYFSDEGWSRTSVYVPSEMELTIYINQKALVTILCTAAKLNYLVLGYLYAEGIISGVGDVASIRVSEEESLADVRLNNSGYELPALKRLGCSGSSVFKTQGQKVESDLVVTPLEVLSLMKQFQEQMVLYPHSGGVHTSALSDTRNLLVVAEDIGRHNTLNKIQGECLLYGISTRDRLLLITGRISSEMLLKAAKMQVPVVVSRHAPTKNAILLARDMGIALVGKARGDRLAVFTHPERLGCSTD
ncbi:formate dehydrogenase accessory sulfurtransferase FdhD [Desulfoscipio gibsoniae]|uniref:Sulfur carrier protein FdhD n=1 Tax=Desulfoscipio gibsoniae DSM 7213 TaxID=767817 RepID=R4KKG7_9FIRM|nr:formate dehydrogenase accessory sulfurtransferase FdhD [Desulfoscipio gibsoniae]AGL03154.1 formate dehydrogenase family accessory protein FdhD [Desulfoscipio gibsoniae DSM 7213]